MPHQRIGPYGVMNTLRALERLASSSQSTTEMADYLKIDPRSARKLLQRLTAEGYATQEDSHRKRYHATLRLAAVARQLLERATLPRLAEQCAAELAATTRCVAHVWLPAPCETVCLLHGTEPRTAPPITVLAPERPRHRSCAYDADAAAAAIVDGGWVVAAIGITGAGSADQLAAVVAAARALSTDLALSPEHR